MSNLTGCVDVCCATIFFRHCLSESVSINIVHRVTSSQVCIIQGSTGSGKTTQVPQYILDSQDEAFGWVGWMTDAVQTDVHTTIKEP